MDLQLNTRPADGATVGVMIAGPLDLHTIELPWHDNVARESCVPAGTYQLIPYPSPEHGPTWCLHNPALGVWSGTGPRPPGHQFYRTYCEIHSANWADELLGCIAVGFGDAPMVNPRSGRLEPAIERSRDALLALVKLLGPLSRGHTLTITRE